jgi:zinc transporter ZupT
VFWLHIIVMFLYVAIVMFALPEVIANDLLFAVAAGCLIGLHLVYKDYLLRAEAPADFQATGRTLLIAAPLLGWVAHRALGPSEAVLDIFVAILAGVLLQGVFRDELPRAERASLPWVLAGVSTFAALSILT